MAGLLDMLPQWTPPQQQLQGLLNAAPGGYGPTTREAAEAFPQRLMGLLGGLIGAPSPEESANLSALYQKVRETPTSEGIFPQSMRDFGRAALPYMMDAATIRAYHGSPYDFDKFSLSKIGTGEGAQAYGHGLYFAEEPGVARQYRDQLARIVDTGDPRTIAKAQMQARGGRQEAIDYMRRNLDAEKAKAAPDQEWINKYAPVLEVLERGDEVPTNVGRLYTVDIDADPPDFLDWDKPLSEQPEIAKRLGFSTRSYDEINNEGIRIMEEGNKANGGPGTWMNDKWRVAKLDELNDELNRVAPNITGADIYRGTDESNYLHGVMSHGNSIPARSAEMIKTGVKGIRYKDAGSRAAADGTYNYVVFDDSLVDIVGKE